jgi:hypothetical protein
VSDLIAKLDALLEEYRSKGLEPDLRPGLSQRELVEWQSSTGLKLPEDLRQLFSWRNGCANTNGEPETLLLFRDNVFIGLDDYKSAIEGLEPFVSSYEEYDTFPFKIDRSIPIAEFEGNYYVVPLDMVIPNHPHPVICVGEDLAVHFYSLASMLDTCVEWARDTKFVDGDPNQDQEIIAWQRYNPGVFEIEI